MTWTLGDLAVAAGADAVVRGHAVVTGISYDSREVAPGDLFCCIPGARADGHDFARAAVDGGAAALLVERDVGLDVGLDVPQARVPRVRDVLGPLSSAFFGHPSRAMRVAGVTGTNGKTTVTYLVEAMAAAGGIVGGVIGTVDRRVAGETVPAPRTTPESVDLQRLLGHMRHVGASVVAMEVTSDGMDQCRVDGTWFACAAFTNLTQDHLDTHGTMESYFEAKARLFDPVFTRHAVVNVADAFGERLLGSIGGLRVLTFGSPGADIYAWDVALSAAGTSFRAATPAGRLDISTPLVGRHNVENVLCAAGIALVLELAPEAIAEGARRLRGVPGRLEPVGAGQPFTVLVDYAHTPDALANALRAARELARGRVIVVFGCGGDRDRAKRPLMGAAATSAADLTIITSDNPRSEDPLRIIAQIEAGAARGPGPWRAEPDRRTAIAEAIAEARAGDVVLIAGKGHETGQTFAGRTVPFDDREVARELLGAVRA